MSNETKGKIYIFSNVVNGMDGGFRPSTRTPWSM